MLRFVHSRDWLIDGAESFYRNVNEAAVIGQAAARLLDPVRYPMLRSTFALLHVPALAVLALYPLAPPHWVAGIPYADGPPAHPSAAPQRDGGGGQPPLRRPGDDRRGRALAASARARSPG